MARKVATLLLVFGYCTCMEMRETVERTVMVRTTGSDLQPAATGYIYKKKSDGPVSVIKMGESEVIEHFSKLYSTPKAYEEPTAEESPVYSKEKEELKSAKYSNAPHASSSHVDLTHPPARDTASQASASHAGDELVKPIVEVNQEEDKIDGIANEEFDKLFEDYIKKLDRKTKFSDYVHGLGHYDHGIYHGYRPGDGEDYGLKRYGYGGQEEGGRYNQYEKGESKDDYVIGDQGRYFVLKDRDQGRDFTEGNDHGRHYIHRHNNKDVDYAHEGAQAKGKAVGGFHEGFRLDKLKKDNDFYDGEAFKGANHPYSGGHGSIAKENGGRNSHDAGHRDGYFGASDDVEKESGDDHNDEQSSEESDGSGHSLHRNFGVKGQLDTGESFRYEIKH